LRQTKKEPRYQKPKRINTIKTREGKDQEDKKNWKQHKKGAREASGKHKTSTNRRKQVKKQIKETKYEIEKIQR